VRSPQLKSGRGPRRSGAAPRTLDLGEVSRPGARRVVDPHPRDRAISVPEIVPFYRILRGKSAEGGHHVLGGYRGFSSLSLQQSVPLPQR
jgi:hypothetical protein